MAQLILLHSSGASKDLRSSMRMCNQLDDELNNFEECLKVETIDPDYRQCLLSILGGAKNYKQWFKRGTENVEHILGETDGSDETSDPQYELFFKNLKKCGKSYVLEGKINDKSVYVKYEEESKLGEKCGPNHHRRMVKDIVRIGIAANQNPGLPNEQAPVNQNASDRGKEIYKEPDLGNRGGITESEVGLYIPLSNRIDNLESCKTLKNVTVVRAKHMRANNRRKGPHGQALSGKADNGDDVKKHYNL